MRRRPDRPNRDGRGRGTRNRDEGSFQHRPGPRPTVKRPPRRPQPAPRRDGVNARPARSDKPVLWKPGPDARVVRSEAGQRLATFVSHLHPSLSVRGARRLIDEGCCRVNGRIETFGSRELAGGDVVECFLPEEPREHVFDPRRVVYDADGFIAYDKPSWLPVTPIEGRKSWSLLDIITQALPQPIIPVHRLDADTSGIVLFARSEKVARSLEAMFRDHQVKKTYHAIVRGHPRASGERRSYLVKVESGRGFERWKSGRGQDAREATTTWELESRLGPYASLVKVVPLTGRYHQIRIHFSEMGHSIYGDRIYGDRQDPIHVGRHLLHASLVQLPSIDGKGQIEIRTRLPREFLDVQKRLLKM